MRFIGGAVAPGSLTPEDGGFAGPGFRTFPQALSLGSKSLRVGAVSCNKYRLTKEQGESFSPETDLWTPLAAQAPSLDMVETGHSSPLGCLVAVACLTGCWGPRRLSTGGASIEQVLRNAPY